MDLLLYMQHDNVLVVLERVHSSGNSCYETRVRNVEENQKVSSGCVQGVNGCCGCCAK